MSETTGVSEANDGTDGAVAPQMYLKRVACTTNTPGYGTMVALLNARIRYEATVTEDTGQQLWYGRDHLHRPMFVPIDCPDWRRVWVYPNGTEVEEI